LNCRPAILEAGFQRPQAFQSCLQIGFGYLVTGFVGVQIEPGNESLVMEFLRLQEFCFCVVAIGNGSSDAGDLLIGWNDRGLRAVDSKLGFSLAQRTLGPVTCQTQFAGIEANQHLSDFDLLSHLNARFQNGACNLGGDLYLFNGLQRTGKVNLPLYGYALNACGAD